MSGTAIQVRRLVSPSADEIDRATDTLVDAFADDLSVHAMCGGTDRSERFKFHRSVITDGLVAAHVYVANYGDEPFAGIAVWYPPGSDYLGTEEQRDAGFNQWAATWSPELSAWWDKFIPLYTEVADRCFGDGVKTSSWALVSFGVRKRFQGRGIGRALLKAGEDLAAAEGKLAILETETQDQIEMYEHLGWKKMGGGRVAIEPYPFDLVVMSKSS